LIERRIAAGPTKPPQRSAVHVLGDTREATHDDLLATTAARNPTTTKTRIQTLTTQFDEAEDRDGFEDEDASKSPLPARRCMHLFACGSIRDAIACSWWTIESLRRHRVPHLTP
jgi:hypothetical protein